MNQALRFLGREAAYWTPYVAVAVLLYFLMGEHTTIPYVIGYVVGSFTSATAEFLRRRKARKVAAAQFLAAVRAANGRHVVGDH